MNNKEIWSRMHDFYVEEARRQSAPWKGTTPMEYGLLVSGRGAKRKKKKRS